jgi:hypothetical protein
MSISALARCASVISATGLLAACGVPASMVWTPSAFSNRAANLKVVPADLTRAKLGRDAEAPVTITAPLMAAESATSSTGPAPPAYKQDGTSPAASLHIVKNINRTTVKANGSCSPNTWCSLDNNNIALSSAAEFTSTNYSCALSSSSSYRLILMVNGQTTTGFTIQAYYPAVLTIIPGNTNLGIQYECSGE